LPPHSLSVFPSLLQYRESDYSSFSNLYFCENCEKWGVVRLRIGGWYKLVRRERISQRPTTNALDWWSIPMACAIFFQLSTKHYIGRRLRWSSG
jgi:hypothetical protein